MSELRGTTKQLDGKIPLGQKLGSLPVSPTDPRYLRADVVMGRPFDELIENELFASRQRTVTETDVVSFAALTGDWHSAHTNQVWAERNIFGERVAHGMLLLSYAVGLVPNPYIVALRRVKNVIYKVPVRFGDTLHVLGKVVKLKPYNDELGLVSLPWKLLNHRGETCLKMEYETLWRRSWIT